MPNNNYEFGRPPIERMQALINLGETVYPQHPGLLQLVLTAVLGRIARSDTHEARWLSGLIRELASLETQSPWDEQTQHAVLARLVAVHAPLDEVVVDPPVDVGTPEAETRMRRILHAVLTLSRITDAAPSPHEWLTLERQRNLVGAYLKEHRYDESSPQSDERIQWVLAHLTELLDLVKPFSCPCLTTDAGERQEEAKITMEKRLEDGIDLTMRSLSMEVVAAYHCLAPETVREKLNDAANIHKTLPQ